MIQGLTANWTSITTTAKATGNHTGAPTVATARKPTPMRRATRVPNIGSERRRTKLMAVSFAP
jgi:hypothetical protein